MRSLLGSLVRRRWGRLHPLVRMGLSRAVAGARRGDTTSVGLGTALIAVGLAVARRGRWERAASLRLGAGETVRIRVAPMGRGGGGP